MVFSFSHGILPHSNREQALHLGLGKVICYKNEKSWGARPRSLERNKGDSNDTENEEGDKKKRVLGLTHMPGTYKWEKTTNI